MTWLGAALCRRAQAKGRQELGGRNGSRALQHLEQAAGVRPGEREEAWTEQRAFNQILLPGVNPQKKGESGKIDVC